MLDDRKSLVLQAVIEEYIRTGQPVSSQAVLERSGLEVSASTIRNDLARLESYGFVSQPHTSAGRVPTHQGYRFYVDHMGPGKIRAATRSRIESFFSEMHQELGRLLKETSSLLADVTHFPAFVIGPGLEAETIHATHLVRLGGTAVLLVVVAESGRVVQQVVSLDVEPSNRQLEEAERILDRAFAGKHFADVSGGMALEEIPDALRRIVQPVEARLLSSGDVTREVFVGGTAQLAQIWNDLAVVRRLLAMLEAESTLRRLVEDDEGTSVRFGAELGNDVDLAVVSSDFDAGDRGTGRVGVLGPMRMDYRRTMRVVETVGENLEERLGSE